MKKIFILQKIKSDLAFLKSEKDDLEVYWPVSLLPKGFNIGDKLNFLISLDNSEDNEKKQLAKDILNEILD